MLDGLPSFFEYVIKLASAPSKRNSTAIVLYHLLDEVINACEDALNHYLPLNLDEPFLQNSSIGTPYQKWAKFTSEDFEEVDESLHRLIPAVWQRYQQVFGWRSASASNQEKSAENDAWRWLDRFNTEYVCAVVKRESPELTTSTINITGWIDPSTGCFRKFLNRPPSRQLEQPPSIVTHLIYDISDRSVISELRSDGLANLGLLREANANFANWLRVNYSMDDATAGHEGTLSDGSFVRINSRES